MTRRRRRLLLLWLLLSAPLLLEANARRQADCPTRSPGDPCATAVPPEAVAQRQAVLEDIAAARQDGRETLDRAEAAARSLVVWVSDADWPYNGVACRSAVFIKVRDDLPALAERYVLLHELEHLLSPQRSETEVNYVTARRVPIGMGVTVASSVARRLTGEGSMGCKLASLWRTFQRYFLNQG